jgi:hypothetical protein
MTLFSLTTQVAGRQESVRADSTVRAITVESARGSTAVADLSAATDLAGRILGPGLEAARRSGAPWGLHVEAAGYEAVYGDWPLLQIPTGRPRPTAISEIRSRFRAEDGPIDALNNAIRIIEAVAHSTRKAA